MEANTNLLPSTELAIVEALVANLAAFRDGAVYLREVRSHGRARADLVLNVGGEIVAIEVKRSDWKRAIAQAVLNRVCADRSYIALWASSISSTVLAEAERWGLGVLAVGSGSLTEAIRAEKQSPEPSIHSRLLLEFAS